MKTEFASLSMLNTTFPVIFKHCEESSLTNNRISFSNSNLGVDIIESVFDICDAKETEDGLSLMEVKEGHCMNYLVRVLGMLDENIEKDFKAIDENGDGLVSKEEGFKAYEKFALDRPPTVPQISSPKVLGVGSGLGPFANPDPYGPK